MTNHKSPITNDKSMAQFSRVHPSAEGGMPIYLRIESSQVYSEKVLTISEYGLDLCYEDAHPL
jgi:hypothetical protein